MTSDVLVEVIPLQAEFQAHPEHFKWIGDLNATWQVALGELGGSDVKWNARPVKRSASSTFYFEGVSPGERKPTLSNRVFCVGQDGKAVSQWFGAPVLYSSEPERLEDLTGYEITHLSGKPLEGGRKDVGDLVTRLNFPAHTPVFRAVFFLPVPARGESYETHFFPMISTPSAAANYLIVENNAINAGQISQPGHGRQLMNVDESSGEHYHKATFTPDAALEGKVILPAYEGRMLILSKPIEVKEERRAPVIRGHDFRCSEFFDHASVRTLGVKAPRAEVDTVSIGRGMASANRAGLVEARERFDELPTVFDIRCLGVRRTEANRYSPEVVKELFRAAYQVPRI